MLPKSLVFQEKMYKPTDEVTFFCLAPHYEFDLSVKIVLISVLSVSSNDSNIFLCYFFSIGLFFPQFLIREVIGDRFQKTPLLLSVNQIEFVKTVVLVLILYPLQDHNFQHVFLFSQRTCYYQRFNFLVFITSSCRECNEHLSLYLQAELINPAVKGTLNVLKSCKKFPTVKRVVLTSSIASVIMNGKPLTPDVVVDETWYSNPLIAEKNKVSRFHFPSCSRFHLFYDFFLTNASDSYSHEIHLRSRYYAYIRELVCIL